MPVNQSLAKGMTLALISSLFGACQPTEQPAPNSNAPQIAETASLPISASTPIPTKPVTRTPRAIDWATIDSGVAAVDQAQFNYPFALDSKPVQAYADMYHVDALSARYNLTVGMAVNEVLDKVLDQIGTAYVSHELTAGKTSEFIIHTTPRIAPSRYTYVFAEPFARGLSIEVVIVDDGVKQPRPTEAHHQLTQSAN